MRNYKFGNCSISLKGDLVIKAAFDKAFAGKLRGKDIGEAYLEYKKAYKASEFRKVGKDADKNS